MQVCRNKTYPLIFKTDQTIWKLIKEDKTISNNFINLSYKNINTISNSEVIVNEIDDETNSSDDESTVEIVERLSKILNEVYLRFSNFNVIKNINKVLYRRIRLFPSHLNFLGRKNGQKILKQISNQLNEWLMI